MSLVGKKYFGDVNCLELKVYVEYWRKIKYLLL